MNIYMKEANKEVLINQETNFKNGGPFGAVIVKDGKIIAKAHNTVLKDQDATAHAEINAIRKASKVLNTHDLTGCEIYTTCYPCPMCLSACIWANIKTIYYGNTKEDAEKLNFRDNYIYKVFENPNKELQLIQLDRKETIKAFNEFENQDHNIY
ncbi:MAG: nucleoside deaminase [Bacilli bacterium]|nr:nucleoside deaminase [Bacilli bacterium]